MKKNKCGLFQEKVSRENTGLLERVEKDERQHQVSGVFDAGKWQN